MQMEAKKSLCRAILVFVVALSPILAVADNYPAKPVRVIVTLPAGSGTDILARHLTDVLSRSTAQRFFVENRPGAGGNIGMAAAEKSTPDGYTAVFSGLGSQVINSFVYDNQGWDHKNFDPVILVARLPFLIAVTPSLPANSLEELVALAKAKPDSINISVTSTTSRIANELLKRVSNMSLFPVTYTSPNPATIDAIGGRVSVIIETVSALLPHVNSGKLRALAITTQKTSALVPNLRSVSEQGYPAFGEFVGWTSMLVPKGTPQEAIHWLNVEMNKILAQPSTQRRLAELGAEPGSGTPQELAAYVASERERWGPIIREAKIKVE